MNVIVKTIHTEVPQTPEFAHVIAALKELGFAGHTKHVDMIAYEEDFWVLNEPSVDLGSAASVTLTELADKLQVFQSVPVTSNEGNIFFTIEDYWG